MRIALDKNGNRVHIDSAKVGEEYFCPSCGSGLILRKGDIRIHHFAHKINCICTDSWHYDMTDWHHNWQSLFPVECQEVIKSLGGEKHRADVLIEETKTVIEFQHSPLSSTEFEARNEFYNKLGYKVVWIFDVYEQYSDENIENYKKDLWRWERPLRTFHYYNHRNSMVQLFLELDESELVKVTWATDDNGLSRFATDGNIYNEQHIIDMFGVSKNNNSTLKFADLYDKLIKLNHKDHTTYYWGCPISKTHKCTNNTLDIPANENITSCEECNFQIYDSENMLCTKRFQDLNLDKNAIVKIEERDSKGFISKISCIRDGKTIFIEIPTCKDNTESKILDLWKSEYAVAIFLNTRTGKYIKISNDPIYTTSKYGKVYGRISSDQYNFDGDSMEIYYADKPQWIIVWSRNK